MASFDMPGLGGEPLPADFDTENAAASKVLSRWRDAGAESGLAKADSAGWDRFLLVTDSYGAPTAARLARRRPDSVIGVAIGHASLSHANDGDRAPMRAGIWEAMAQLASQGNEAFVRYGIAQMTRGGISEEVAQEMVERFPDIDLVTAMVNALGEEPEPIGDDLSELRLPLLLGKHEGCLSRTDEGFDDICVAFPDAQTVICPEACSSSPAFAQAVKEFSDLLDA